MKPNELLHPEQRRWKDKKVKGFSLHNFTK